MLTGPVPAARRRMRVARPGPRDRQKAPPSPTDPTPQRRLGPPPRVGWLLGAAGAWARHAGPATLSSWAGYPPGLPVLPPRLPPALDRFLLGGAAGALLGAGVSATCRRFGAAAVDIRAAGAALAGAAAAGAVLVLGAADPDRAVGSALLAFSLQSVSLTPLPAGVAGATLAGLLTSVPPPRRLPGARRAALGSTLLPSTPGQEDRRVAER